MPRATGIEFAARYHPNPKESLPATLFSPTYLHHLEIVRFVSDDDPTQALVYTYGVCITNQRSGSRAGWGIVRGPPFRGPERPPSVVSGRLEKEGQFGETSAATSILAELRATIAALRCCSWG